MHPLRLAGLAPAISVFLITLMAGAPLAADWKGSRDMHAEYGQVLALIAKTWGKIVQEIFILLGAKIGKQTAHEVIQDLAREAWQKNITLRQVIEAHAEVARHFTREQLDNELDPAKYIGLSPQVVDRTLAEISSARASERF